MKNSLAVPKYHVDLWGTDATVFVGSLLCMLRVFACPFNRLKTTCMMVTQSNLLLPPPLSFEQYIQLSTAVEAKQRHNTKVSDFIPFHVVLEIF